MCQGATIMMMIVIMVMMRMMMAMSGVTLSPISLNLVLSIPHRIIVVILG